MGAIKLLALVSTIALTNGLSYQDRGSNSIFSISISENELETRISLNESVSMRMDPPPHEATARMARYITHNSG